MTDLLALVGNPRPGSRTARVATAALDAVASRLGGSPEQQVIDLASLLETHGSPFGADAADRYAEPLASVRSARFLIVATPTFKASYTGLLKAFADHVRSGEWSGVVAVPLITVGNPSHTLSADVHLRPLLVELGASTPTASLVVGEPDLADPSDRIKAWLEGAAPVLDRLLQRR